MAGKKSGAKQKWNKDRIRTEILRLDAKTGLSGGKITIRLYEDPEPLGLFTFADPVRMTFGFSSTRFSEPGFTDAEALDIIRHEYAHFMEYKLFGESSDHGPNWKKCCLQIGARPEKLYTEDWKAEARRKQKELTRRTRVDGYTVGKHLHHPAFGDGVVEKIDRLATMTLLSIRFGDTVKVLDVDWVRQHCGG